MPIDTDEIRLASEQQRKNVAATAVHVGSWTCAGGNRAIETLSSDIVVALGESNAGFDVVE
jgi:hypothetical protein